MCDYPDCKGPDYKEIFITRLKIPKRWNWAKLCKGHYIEEMGFDPEEKTALELEGK